MWKLFFKAIFESKKYAYLNFYKIRKEHCLVTLTETVLFAPSQLLSSRVRCIEIVYGCLT